MITIPNFLVLISFHFTMNLLLCCLNRASATRNDLFNVHVLCTCGIEMFPLAPCTTF